MKYEELESLVANQLRRGDAPKDALAVKGSVLYSGLNTLNNGSSGGFYLMAYNPADSDKTILQSLCAESGRDGITPYSAYTMNCWKKCNIPHAAGVRIEARHRRIHQRRVVSLCALLNGAAEGSGAADDATEGTFSCNALFASSREPAALPNKQAWWDTCWPVHQVFLSEIRPRWIIALGKSWQDSSFALLRQKAIEATEIACTGRNTYGDGRHFHARLPVGANGDQYLKVNILAVPHPSSRRPMSNELIDWIKANVQSDRA